MTNEKLKSFIAEITFIYISYRNGTYGVHGLYMWLVLLVQRACTDSTWGLYYFHQCTKNSTDNTDIESSVVSVESIRNT